MLEDETPQKDASLTNANSHACVAGTPSRSTARSSDLAHSRTPQSSSKRYFLDLFAGTPLKRKRDEKDVGTGSSSKRKFATPSFLRRSAPLAPIAEDYTESSITAPPFKRRGLVRSLSSMIQGLRKNEEERMDDEWDVLNEIEEEEEGGGGARKVEAPRILVEDSQAVEMPLGPDKGIESSEDSGPEVEKSRKVWKKKGQKRTTKRTNMRPVLHKAKPAEEDVEVSDNNGGENVADMQLLNGDDDAYAGSEHEDAKTKYLKEAAKKRELANAEEQNNNGKKKKRKIDPNALSHANFRALKIKNKNSKGKAGGGRFGRR